MLFLLRISVEVLPLALPVPQLWFALAVIGGTALFARRRDAGDAALNRVRWALEISALLIIPVVMLAWAFYFWPSPPDEAGSHESLALVVLDGLAIAQAVLAVSLTWRHRRRLWQTVVASYLAAWWTTAALLTGTMAVTNTWN
jgi:membrane protein YdbS with pleckstrin-like domain